MKDGAESRGHASRPSTPTQPQAAEPPRRMPDWAELVRAAPELRRYEQEAAEAAENRFGFWLQWVERYGDFRRAVEQAAEAGGVTFGDAMRVVTARLAAAYDSAVKPKRPRR